MFIWLRILAPNFRPYFTLIQTPGIRIPWLTLIGTVCCYLNKWYNSCKGTYSSLLSIWLRVCKIRTQQIITIVLKTILKISKHAENHVQGSHFFYPIKFPDFSLTFPWFPKSFPWFFLSFHQDILVQKTIFILFICDLSDISLCKYCNFLTAPEV